MIFLDRETRLNLKAEIIKKGVLQYIVGQSLGISENAFSQMLNGRRAIPEAKLEELKALLGMEQTGVSV